MLDRRDFLAGALGLAGAAAADATAAAKADKIGSRLGTAPGPDFLVTLDPVAPGESMYEPHIAVDPRNPDRIAVAAQYGIKGGRAGRRLYLWISQDAGRTWFGNGVPRPKFEGEFTADPLVAFDSDGHVLVVGDCAPRAAADFNQRTSFTRWSVPSQVQPTRIDNNEELLKNLRQTVIGVSRTEDNGRTLTSTAMPGVSVGADKSSIAVDRNPASPHRGAIYVSWFQMMPQALRIARSVDGGRTFSEAAIVETWANPFMQQIAVRPDGSVHLVWTLAGGPGRGYPSLLRENAPPEAWNAIYHSVSTDGGVTFSKPVVAATHAGAGLVSIPSLAVDRDGRLLWIWGQAEKLPDLTVRPVPQAQHRLYGICSEDGASWSKPFELCPWQPADTHMGLPAITSDGKSWWILAYLADSEQTRVVLLRSGDRGMSFRLDRVLAARAVRFNLERTLAKRTIPVGEFSLMGTFILRNCDDIAQAGDYVGVAAVGSRIAAAFVLPETDKPTSRATVHVAIADVR